MRRRTWMVFWAVQLVGCVFTSYSRGDSDSLFIHLSRLVGFLLLYPGNLPATALAETLIHVPAGLIFFPVALGFNAMLWVAFSAVWRTLRGRRSLTPRGRYGIALFGAIVVFSVINIINFYRPVSCFDCFLPHGLPFRLYREGGFAGGAGLIWRGLAADVGVIILAAAFVGSAWQWFASRRAI
jgi:hypothetical protein